MSYTHVSVSAAIKQHDELIKTQARIVTPETKYNKWVMYEGVLVRPELIPYMQAVQKAFRGVRFYASRDLSWKWGQVELPDGTETTIRSTEIACQVYVAFPDQLYCMGTIGYNEFQKSTSNNVYMVGARTIRNEKYADHNDEYHYVLTGDMARAVKNAKTYLRPYTPKDFMELSLGQATHYARIALSDAENKVYRTVNDIPSDEVNKELYRLLKANHVFANSKLRECIAEWVEAVDVRDVEEKRKMPMCYVHVRPQLPSAAPEEQLVDTYAVADLRNNKLSSKRLLDEATVSTKRVADLHPDFVGKLSVLSLLTDGDHVDDVGVRVSSNVFWVYCGDIDEAVG